MINKFKLKNYIKLKKKKNPHHTCGVYVMRLVLFYWVICKFRNWDIKWIIKWVNKIDKVMFENVKLVYFVSLDTNALMYNWDQLPVL